MFLCFAPKDNPKIAVAAYVENAGFGATWALRFPLLHPGSNMDEGSVECTEAYMLTQPMSTMAI